MNGEVIDGLGPTFCTQCKTSPGTSIRGENHPICVVHRNWLQDWFREHPERKLGWDGEWNERMYGWFEGVNETQDNTGTPGDSDKPYTYMSPTTMLDRGMISMKDAGRLFRLREAHFGKGLRVEMP